jgi:uncharacterized protein
VTNAFFYDTWAFVALADRRDPAHVLAVELDEQLERRGFVAVTTDYVLDESVTLLQAAAGASVSVAFLGIVRDRCLGQDLKLVTIGELRRERAELVFGKLAREERRLSFTDATSFAVMSEFGIELAFTADRHFHRAGTRIRPLVELRKGRFVTSDF